MREPWIKPLSVPVSIFFLVMALTVTGLIAVYSASASVAGHEERQRAAKRGVVAQEAKYHDTSYLKKQLMFAGMGLAGLIFFYNFDYRKLKGGSFVLMAICFVACGLVWAPGIGVESNGSRRWLRLGIGQLQPSEFAKLGLIIYMAKMLDDRHRYIKSFFSGVLPAMIVTGAFALIIVLEPDFGAAFVLCTVIFGMWICGEVRWFHLIGLVSAAIPAAIAAFILEPYRIKRVLAFLSDDPELRMREGFQLYQSLIAVGSGGPFGLGLGNSLQKHHYLSASHTDFIFAIMGEELGFVRCTVILLFYAALVMMGWYVALNTSDLFGSLLATGITLMLFLGTTINLCVVLGLLPTKGLVLPFMSAGGSNLLVMMAGMGILMNIAKRQFALTSRPIAPAPLMA